MPIVDPECDGKDGEIPMQLDSMSICEWSVGLS